MSDTPMGPNWWQASDGRWYPPEARPGVAMPPPPPQPSAPWAPVATDATTSVLIAPRKPWWRKWWVITLGVLVILGAIGAITGAGKKDDDAQGAATPIVSTTNEPTSETSGSAVDTEPSAVSESLPATSEAPTAELPTTTETPTTPLPTTTTEPEGGLDLGSPAPVGETVRVGDWAIRVRTVTPDAAAAIAAENQFNDAPAEGKQFFMAEVEATYVGGESSTFWLEMNLKAVGASSVAYERGSDADCGVIPNDVTNAGEAFPGGTVTGNVCWEIDTADATTLAMIAEPTFSFDDSERRFLSMDPTATPVDDPTASGAPTPQAIQGVPIGEAVQIGDWSIKVVSVIPDASAEIVAGNQFNDPPVEGNQFFMAAIEATYTGTETSTFWIDTSLKAVGITSVAYEGGFGASCGVISNELTDAGETFPGGTISGNVCWSIKTSDASSLAMLAEESFSIEDSRGAFSLV